MSNRTRTRRSLLQALGVAGTGAAGVGALSSRGRGTHESDTGSAATSPSGYRWRTDVGDEPDRAVVAGDGVLYAASTSDDDGVITAIEAESGDRRWEVDADVVGRPAASDDYCFSAETGSVVARHPDDGSVAWRAPIDGTPRTGIELHDGTLYLAARDGGGRLYAVDAADGTKRWTVGDHCRTALSVGSATPGVVGDTLVTSVDGQLRGYARTDGAERWSADQRAYALSAGPDVAVACWRGAVRAVAADGTERWARELPADVTGLRTVGVAADGGDASEGGDSPGVVVARTVGSPAGRYRALSLADGESVWEFSTDEGPISMPTASDGVVYAGTGSGHLHAFDPATGDVVTTYDAEHGLHDRPAVVDGTVAVPSDEGFVYGFEAL